MKTVVQIENGKYTFIVENGGIDILRFGNEWVSNLSCNGVKAIMALIFELEEARNDLKRITEMAINK